MEWVIGGLAVAVVLYIILRVGFVYYFCGGKDTGDYYSDSQK
jgi:hypothetical protein